MINLFFGNRSYALLFLPLIVVAIFSVHWFFGVPEAEEVWRFGLLGNYHKNGLYLLDFFAPALTTLGAILVNVLFNRNEFMDKNNYISSLIYVVLMSFFPTFYYLSGLSIAQVLLVLVAFQLFRMKQNEDARRHAFNAAFIFSLACVFVPPLLLCTPLLFSMLWVIRPFVWRESALVLMGLTGPLLYSAVFNFFFEERIGKAQFNSGYESMEKINAAYFALIVVLLLAATARPLSIKLRTSSIRLKKLFRLLAILISIGVISVLIEFLMFESFTSGSLTIFTLVFVVTYAFGERELRSFPVFVFYMAILLTVGKFFISFDQITAYLS